MIQRAGGFFSKIVSPSGGGGGSGDGGGERHGVGNVCSGAGQRPEARHAIWLDSTRLQMNHPRQYTHFATRLRELL